MSKIVKKKLSSLCEVHSQSDKYLTKLLPCRAMSFYIQQLLYIQQKLPVAMEILWDIVIFSGSANSIYYWVLWGQGVRQGKSLYILNNWNCDKDLLNVMPSLQWHWIVNFVQLGWAMTYFWLLLMGLSENN